MATLAQLRSEPWWDREIVTVELDWLGDELCRRTGRPRAAFGSKGNTAHLKGAHRSQEWILNSRFCTSRTSTVQSGLTATQARHIAGGDFTPGEWGTAANRALMVEQTTRLRNAMVRGQLPGVTQVIGTLNGRTVVGTRPDGSTFSSDDSHLDHWHLTFDRRRCADRAVMERILAVALGEDDDMTPQELLNTKVGSPALGERTVADWLKGGQSAANKVDSLTAKVDALTQVVATLAAPGAGQALMAKLEEIDREATERADALAAEVNEVASETVEALGAVESEQEIADRLRAVLGDKAAEVGRLLAAG